MKYGIEKYTKELERNVKKEGTVVDRIKLSYLKSDYKLSQSDQEIHNRILQIDALQKKGYNRRLIVVQLSQKFQVSQATIYRDLNKTLEVFGDLRRTHIEAEILNSADMALDMARQAKEEGDLATAIRSLDLYNKIITPFANNLEEEKEEESKFVIEIKSENSRKKKTVSMDDFSNIDAVDFEEVQKIISEKHPDVDDMLSIIEGERKNEEGNES